MANPVYGLCKTGRNHGSPDDKYQNAVKSYERNGVWGTCVDCPHDKDGWSYPEKCVYYERYDHQISDAPSRRFF